MTQKKHFGTFGELQDTLTACGRSGSWRKLSNPTRYRFDGDLGEVVNWWPGKGTVQVQGQDHETLEPLLARKLASQSGLPAFIAIQTQHESLVASAKKQLAAGLGIKFERIKIYIEP